MSPFVQGYSERDFRFFVPADLFVKGDDTDPTSRRIGGFVTTEHPDRDGEIVLQNGLDFSDFLTYGHFNDNHGQKTGDMLGWPISVELRKTPDGRQGHWVEGHLIRGWKPADDIWDLHQALLRSKAPRRLGFSVEGKIEQRGEKDGHPAVVKARVRNVAVTSQPVNPYTGMEALTKALMAGSAVDAPAATPGQGYPLRVESLEGAPHDLTFTANSKRKRKRRRLSQDEALGRMVRKGYSAAVANAIVALAQTL